MKNIIEYAKQVHLVEDDLKYLSYTIDPELRKNKMIFARTAIAMLLRHIEQKGEIAILNMINILNSNKKILHDLFDSVTYLSDIVVAKNGHTLKN